MPTWDDVIDEMARRLTGGDPRLGFTARVVARLDGPARRWSRAWLLAPVAAAAIVVVLAVIMPREAARDVALGPAPATIERPQVGGMETSSRAEARDAGPEPGSMNRGAAPQDLHVTAAIAPSAPASTSPSDLDIESIVNPPVDLAPATIAALEAVPPLAVEEITIEPLDTLIVTQ